MWSANEEETGKEKRAFTSRTKGESFHLMRRRTREGKGGIEVERKKWACMHPAPTLLIGFATEPLILIAGEPLSFSLFIIEHISMYKLSLLFLVFSGTQRTPHSVAL
jgi:hypothetical protein